jgi:hypothetical protein
LFRAIAASKTDTAINESILLARLGFTTGTHKELFLPKQQQILLVALNQSFKYI